MREIRALIRAPLRYRFGSLFMSLLLLLALPGVLPERLEALAIPIVFTLVLSTGVSAVGERRNSLVIAVAIAAPTLLLIWAGPALNSRIFPVVGGVLLAMFLAYAAAAILNHVLHADRVDAEAIYGAVCVYFLLAALWGVTYALVEVLAPGSFNLPDPTALTARGRLETGPLMYYSFVTITTLGYGDITPVTELGRLLALLEAVLGQLFLVILVARFVGLYTAREFAMREEGDKPG
ncbi:MAG: two pore domain potassium channel family protein [Gemmatimonadota bacterium]|nr:MAG: two pore domain potassium channel family protein [Gemmatimonadota bacterium]